MIVDMHIVIIKMIEMYKLISRSLVVMWRYLTNLAIQIIVIHPNNIEVANVRGLYPTDKNSM